MVDTTIEENLLAVNQKIQSYAEKFNRDVSSIKLITVTKKRSIEEVESAIIQGQSCFGENTTQDAMTKVPYLSSKEIEWHFIGHLQSKKAGKLPGYFQWIHSVDSIKLAEKLSAAYFRHSQNANLNCLIQVNVSGDETKFGLLIDEVKPFLQELLRLSLPCLQWRGLMTIGVQGNEQETRHVFKQLKDLQQDCKNELKLNNFDQLSMGMSEDFKLAIEEGATMIRVGTSIFGNRL